MTREQRRDVFEAVGLAAIVASLVILAFEIQQNTVAVKSGANHVPVLDAPLFQSTHIGSTYAVNHQE